MSHVTNTNTPNILCPNHQNTTQLITTQIKATCAVLTHYRSDQYKGLSNVVYITYSSSIRTVTSGTYAKGERLCGRVGGGGVTYMNHMTTSQQHYEILLRSDISCCDVLINGVTHFFFKDSLSCGRMRCLQKDGLVKRQQTIICY